MKYLKIPHLYLKDEVDKEQTFIVEEKVDGSQFRVWFDKEGAMHVGSKSVDDNIDLGLFDKAIEVVKERFSDTKAKDRKYWAFFFEYLKKPKHNTLAYDRIPKGHLVLFDVWNGKQFLPYEEIEEIADAFYFEVVPKITEIKWKDITIEKVEEWLETTSFLGGQKIEGVVLKSYERYKLNPYTKRYEPYIYKYVREDFKEKNKVEWKDKKVSVIEKLKKELNNVNRWKKAIIHLKEKGELEYSPRDIPKLFKEINQDIEKEEKEYIKEELYNYFRKEILRGATKGFPEWYKKWLLERDKQ